MTENIWTPPSRDSEQAKPGDTLTIRNIQFAYFPQELIDLRIEIQKHPDLLVILHGQADKDVYIQIMEIATYCKVLVAGDYTQDDMLGLCRVLTQKLMSMRTIVVLPPAY